MPDPEDPLVTSRLDSRAERLDRLADRLDVDALLDTLERADASALKRIAGAARPPRPYAPPEPDADFYGLLQRALSPEQHRLRDRLRRFMTDEVAPIINPHWEAGTFPFEIVPGLRDALHEALGPEPATRYCTDGWATGLVSLEIPRVDPSVGTFLGVHWGLCLFSLHRFGSEAQKARWWKPLENFEAIGSWALTEPEHGSDAAAGLETTATRSGDTWTLKGAKKWSGNASFADVTVVFARSTEDGQVKAFLVEKGTPGFHVETLEGKIAKRSVQNVLITLDGVEVPEANRLPGVKSFRDVAGQLAAARAGVAWEACGMAMGLYEATHRYCTRRRQFAKPIAGFQLVQDGLVRMLGNVTALQGLVLGLAAAAESTPERLHEQAALAKVFCVDKMRETAQIGRGLLGGNGILLEHDVARLFADAEAVYSYEGTREMNALIVGRAVTGLSAFV